ncbi:hypothetical protein KA005_16705, partial [bacterium]|nr:hypothetical protein [bacterium]
LTNLDRVSTNLKSLTSGTDIPIMTSGEYDIQKPSIATNGNEILVIAEENQGMFASDVIITYSPDGGSTWANPIGFTGMEDTMEDKPCVDYTGVNDFQAYGSCMADPMTGDLLIFHFPSMTDPEAIWEESEGWTVWTVGLAGNYEDFTGIDVCGYPHGEEIAPTPDFHGMIAFTCLDASTGLETFAFIYEGEGGSLSIVYMEDVEGEVSDISSDIDLSTGEFYEALEWKNANEEYNLDDGVFMDHNNLEPGNDGWWEDTWTEFTFEGAHNPDVAADGGNCYLVYEMVNPTFGFTDIYCAHSNDNGETFQIDRVTQTDLEEEHYPSVTAIGQTVICTYNRNGNLYTSTSEDGGITWEESEQINDVSGSVAEQSYCADIAGGRYITWTMDAEGTSNIYFDTLELDIAILEIESIAGGFGVSATVKNVGTTSATDVQWSIDLDGTVFVGAHKEGTISNLAAGESVTVKTGLVFGLGGVTIRVTAGGVTQTAEGTVLGPFVIGI